MACHSSTVQIKKVRLAYFKGFWNILDIVVIVIAFCCVVFSIYRTSEVNNKLEELLANPDVFPDFSSLAYWQVTYNSALAILVFICWVKVCVDTLLDGRMLRFILLFYAIFNLYFSDLISIL